MMCTIIQFLFAVRSREPWGAAAGVRTLPGIETSATVFARLVIGAIIQVLVAKQAAPSFITEAVPGFLAGPMETARIPLTLVTKAAFPPAVAPANKTRFGSRRVIIHREILKTICRTDVEIMWGYQLVDGKTVRTISRRGITCVA